MTGLCHGSVRECIAVAATAAAIPFAVTEVAIATSVKAKQGPARGKTLRVLRCSISSQLDRCKFFSSWTCEPAASQIVWPASVRPPIRRKKKKTAGEKPLAIIEWRGVL